MLVPDEIVSRTLGTSTAKTQLSGDKSGNAADYLIPSWCRNHVGVRPFIGTATPVANVGANISLKIESDDLGIRDFEVLNNPSSALLSTLGSAFRDPDYLLNYPTQFQTFGGEKVQYFGVQQEAHSTAYREGVSILLSDQAPSGSPFRAKIGGTPGGAGSNTSTGTATGNVSGATITIAGTLARTIVGVYGAVVPTTYTITDDTSGRFILGSPELAVSIQFAMEAGMSGLGATGAGWGRLAKMEGINVGLAPPSTITTTLNLEVAPGTAANFANGILYQ